MHVWLEFLASGGLWCCMQIARDTASLSLQWDRAYVYISIVYVMYRQTNMKKKVARTKWGVLLCVCVLQADLNDLAATTIEQLG